MVVDLPNVIQTLNRSNFASTNPPNNFESTIVQYRQIPTKAPKILTCMADYMPVTMYPLMKPYELLDSNHQLAQVLGCPVRLMGLAQQLLAHLP